MNTAACLLGVVTVLTSVPTVVMDSTSNQPRVHVANAFPPSCGIEFHTVCRVVGTRTNWAVTAWAVDGMIVAWDTQRDTDALPQARAINVNGQAYATAVVQRTGTTVPQTMTVRATRLGGCQSSLRMEVR